MGEIHIGLAIGGSPGYDGILLINNFFLQGPLDFELVFDRARNSHDRYQDMRMDIDNMSYEVIISAFPCALEQGSFELLTVKTITHRNCWR